MTNEPSLRFLAVDELRSLAGIKWRRDGADFLPAWVADMDIASPQPIVDRVQQIVTSADMGYNMEIKEELAANFVGWQARRHAWTINQEQVRSFCNVLQAIDLVLHFLTEPGDGVILFTPSYPPFLKALTENRCEMIDVPLDQGGWRFDPDQFRRAAAAPNAKVILLANPHNPTGRTFTAEELHTIGEIAIENDLVVINDEVWADLVHPEGHHRPLASLSGEFAAQSVTLSSASKPFNLAGMRAAMAYITHEPLQEAIAALPSHLLGTVSTTGAAASATAWAECEPWLETLLCHLTSQRDHILSRLADEAPQVTMISPEATYLAWLDFRSLGGQWAIDPAGELRKQARIVLSPGHDFTEHGRGFARLNFATSRPILDELLDRIVKAVA